ncbi:hypothetical protein TIFTF001_025028 [Ficus carica]|uniref:Uncharacterized protein n=1 Tax=Ficus carica TaxID=3494 RepID=A0AA88AN15_FICCA|nr:hypothetical protein TIFTF001_025028 [Ficus carica]
MEGSGLTSHGRATGSGNKVGGGQHWGGGCVVGSGRGEARLGAVAG